MLQAGAGQPVGCTVLGGPAGACSGFQWWNETAAIILRLRGEGNRFAAARARFESAHENFEVRTGPVKRHG